MNSRIRNILAISGILMAFAQSAAGPIDDAKRLYFDGKYDEALERLQSLHKRKPKDGTINYYLGLSLIELGRPGEATAPLKVAESRGVADASRILAETAIDEYRVDDAASHLDVWKRNLTKSKKSIPEEFEELGSKVVQLRNMMERVEKIEVIDSLVVDADEFFTSYRLSPEAGRLLPPAAIPAADDTDISIAYLPQNNTEMLWAAAADTTGTYALYGSAILDDGTMENPRILDESLGEGGDANFPFLMPDGMTLYFANNGENSLGGYDIFMTRRNDDGSFFQPQNMGMPYNSPYDDYLLAIDETSGLGWWATDRNRIPGKVTIYIFRPSEMRVNAAPDDPDIAALARMSNISLTQKDGVDYKALLASHLPAENRADGNAIKGASPRFAIDMGNGKVYTSLSDFRNDDARRSMLEYITAKIEYERILRKLEGLRRSYAEGNTSASTEILDIESGLDWHRRHLRDLRNTTVRLENSRH